MNIITENKVELIGWLCGEEMTLQHVHSANLLTLMEYEKLKDIQDSNNKITELLDIILKKGESTCFDFINLLKKKHVNESRPELRDWITTINTPEQDNNAAAPQKKRLRHEADESVDELDNTRSIFPDLKITSTLAKMEVWASDPKNSRHLIGYLEKKLSAENLEKLKEVLKSKQLKNSLCVNARNVEDINKNKELDKFLSETNDVKFPTLTFTIFFMKKSSAPSGRKNECITDDDDDDDDLMRSKNGSCKSDQFMNSTQSYKGTADGNSTSSVNSSSNEDNKEVTEPQCDGQNHHPDQTHKEFPKQEQEALLEDTQGRVNMPEIGEANMKDDSELQCPASASDQVSSEGLCNTQQNAETKAASEEPQSGAEPEPAPAPVVNKRKRKRNHLEKKNDVEISLLCEWAKKQRNSDEWRDKVNPISFKNQTEHGVYPFFTAEKVRLYQNPTTSESQILFIGTEKISSSIKAKLQYLMFVCGVKKAVLVCPKNPNGKQFEYDEDVLRKCKRFISEVFAPALALFKQIQKEELDLLICG